MAKIWRNRIWGETQSFANCPDQWKDEVITLMREDVAKGKYTSEKFTELTGIEYYLNAGVRFALPIFYFSN